MATMGELQDELMGLIYEVWPEITPPNVEPCRFLTTLQALDESFVERIKADATGLPCVVLDIGSFAFDPEWSVRSISYRSPIAVYYIASVDGHTAQPEVDAKLRDFLSAVDSPDADFATFQAIERGSIDTSQNSLINVALANHGKLGNIVAGEVRWDPGLLVELD